VFCVGAARCGSPGPSTWPYNLESQSLNSRSFTCSIHQTQTIHSHPCSHCALLSITRALYSRCSCGMLCKPLNQTWTLPLLQPQQGTEPKHKLTCASAGLSVVNTASAWRKERLRPSRRAAASFCVCEGMTGEDTGLPIDAPDCRCQSLSAQPLSSQLEQWKRVEMESLRVL
jgi:hypothetical protein